MAEFCGAFPVLAGRGAAVRKFAEDCLARKAEFAASLKGQGVSCERWWFQEDVDAGGQLFLYFEAADIGRAFEVFATSSDPFVVWQREEMLAFSGVDVTEPGPPPPEKIFDITV